MSARIISTVGRAIDVIVAGRLVSQLRFAAGVCVLAAALLMASAGGAVAVADSNSSGSAASGDGGTNASGHGGTTARSPVGDVTGPLRETIRRVTSTLGSGRQPGQRPFHRREKPGGRSWRHGHHGPEVGPGPRRAVPNVAPVPNAVAPVPDAAPVPNAVAPVPDAAARRFPMRAAAVSDVSAPVQDMLTSVAGAVVPLTHLQSDLSSFLLGIAGVEPVEGGLRGIDGAGPSATAGASVASQLRLVRPLAGVPGVPVAGNTRTATLGGIAASIFGAMSEAGRASSLPGIAPPAPDGAIPMGVRSFLRHTVSDLPVAVSVAALAAVALPGVGGLVILNLAGVRIGYRQAKAGFVLQTAGIARFAGPGPLGVVRSGSLVVVRPRGLRVVRATGRAGRSAGSRARWAGPTPPRTPLSRHSAPGSIAA